MRSSEASSAVLSVKPEPIPAPSTTTDHKQTIRHRKKVALPHCYRANCKNRIEYDIQIAYGNNILSWRYPAIQNYGITLNYWNVVNLLTTKLSGEHADDLEQIGMAFKNLANNTTCAWLQPGAEHHQFWLLLGPEWPQNIRKSVKADIFLFRMLCNDWRAAEVSETTFSHNNVVNRHLKTNRLEIPTRHSTLCIRRNVKHNNEKNPANMSLLSSSEETLVNASGFDEWPTTFQRWTSASSFLCQSMLSQLTEYQWRLTRQILHKSSASRNEKIRSCRLSCNRTKNALYSVYHHSHNAS